VRRRAEIVAVLKMLFSFLSNLFGATKAVAEEVTQRDAEKNTPEMRANAEAAEREKIKGEATAAVADADLEQLRKDLAE
jgi:hypothetical protein